ncbi:MAG: hypothetical protein OXC91_02095 [Rhodobacteraceae bacterium]|nr:hypothetical protein [Paracoccaceae bacterium]
MLLDKTKILADLKTLPSLPVDVSDWEVQTGTDSADEPAVWIWAVLCNEEKDLSQLIKIRDLVLDHLRKRIETYGIPLGIYVSFRTVDELNEMKPHELAC